MYVWMVDENFEEKFIHWLQIKSFSNTNVSFIYMQTFYTTEILLKVALNTITLTPIPSSLYDSKFISFYIVLIVRVISLTTTKVVSVLVR